MVTQGKGTLCVYAEQFRRKVLHLQDAAPFEMLDYFLLGLAPEVRTQVLVQDPYNFDCAILVAERVLGAHIEAPRGGPTDTGPEPIDLGAIGGSPLGVAVVIAVVVEVAAVKINPHAIIASNWATLHFHIIS